MDLLYAPNTLSVVVKPNKRDYGFWSALCETQYYVYAITGVFTCRNSVTH